MNYFTTNNSSNKKFFLYEVKFLINAKIFGLRHFTPADGLYATWVKHRHQMDFICRLEVGELKGTAINRITHIIAYADYKLSRVVADAV